MFKILISCCLLLLTLTNVTAQGDGIQFNESSWAKILQQATEENRLIFLDAYTSWCGPCKKMARDVFPQKEIGEFYNEKFINVQLDMEKGEGVKVAQDYDIKVYPTLLFIDGKGNLIHRSAGYHDTDQFLALGNIALDPSKRLSAMERQYARGDRSPEFLWNYTHARYQAYDGSHSAIAEEFLGTQSDWSTAENMEFLFSFISDTDSPMFDYLVEHRQEFSEKYGQQAVIGKIQELIYNKVYDSKEKSSLEQVDELFAKAYPEKAKRLSGLFRMTYYRQAGDRENYAKAAVEYFDDFDDNADELNEAAWTFYRVVNNKKLLKKALKWSKKSIKIDDNYYYNDTLAALYYKLKKKKKAIKVAQKAIALAKASGDDFTETEKLLEELQNM